MRQPVAARLVWSARIQPVWPLGRPGSRTCTQRLPACGRRAPSTGRTVRTPVSGRRAATDSIARARMLGPARAT